MIAALVLVALTLQAATTGISIAIEGEKPIVLTLADIQAMPSRAVTVDNHGIKAAYRGVPVADVLARAGLELGQNTRGDRLSWILLVTAADGYRVVYALAELDTGFTDNVVLLAHAKDDKPLPPNEAPLRIVNPGDKRPARWARQVVSLKVSRVP